jgi:Lycopene cyclase
MFQSYQYAYLVGTIIFWIAWVICFALGKRYRSEMRWGTIIACPAAFTSVLFVPQYWTPESLFNLDQKIRVGIEDFLWAAAVGGIAAIVGEIGLRERLAAMRSSRHVRHYWPFLLTAGLLIILELCYPHKTMEDFILSGAVGAAALACSRRDLIPLMLTGTASFTVLYFLLFCCVLLLYPQFVQRFYNLPNLLGIYIAGIPIEELLFTATFGAIWSVAYEYVHGYRLEAAGLI